MMDDEIGRLMSREPDHALDRLERDVWRGVAVQQRNRRTVTAVQSGVLILGLLVSVVMGQRWGNRSAQAVDIFSPHNALAASTLLIRP